MSVENVKKFYESLSLDKELQQKLIDLTQKYQRQAMDDAAVMKIAETDLLLLAKQQGYEFSFADLHAYGEAMKLPGMNLELSDEELAAVVGGGCTGTSLCVIIGVPSGDFSGFCFIIGDIKRVEDGKATASTKCSMVGDLWTST